MRERFWERFALRELDGEEWEALCDGCARCCLVKLEDEDSGEVHDTRLACSLLSLDSCRCSDYNNRFSRVPDCTRVTPDLAYHFDWLPETCAYRRLAKGFGLPDWHPLISGDPESVHRAGVSVRGKVLSESAVPEEDYQEHIVHWV
jgi:uncharacterized cysteine cluster protein YcgN (CxxCxxCC family)